MYGYCCLESICNEYLQLGLKKSVFDFKATVKREIYFVTVKFVKITCRKYSVSSTVLVVV